MDLDDILNGSPASPEITPPAPQSLATTPDTGSTDLGNAGAPRSSSRAILLAWFILFALLVFTHVITLSVQR